MLIGNEIKQFARGERFDVGFKMRILENEFILRDKFLLSDHVYWFSPYTLMCVMSLAGINPKELYFADQERNWLFRICHKITKKCINIRNKCGMTLIAIGDY